MGPRNAKRDIVYARPKRALILSSVITCVSFSLILGMCLAFAAAVAQLGHVIGGVLGSIIVNPLLAVFSALSWIVVAGLAFIVTAAWGELVWLFLALLGLLLSEGIL
jgi:hypothetical protein